MGVSTNFYTVLGIKLQWNEAFSEVYNDAYGEEDLPTVIMDGYAAEYIVLGSVLFDSGDMRWGFEDGDTFEEIKLEDLKDIEKEYKEKFVTRFPEFKHLLDESFSIISFVHYS